MQRAIHLFRRDLRLDDNTALLAAQQQFDEVIPVFILDERQLQHPYFGNNSFQFMLNSLKELNAELQNRGSQLYLFKGIAESIITDILNQTKAEAVFVNRDYTPFSSKRDEAIARVCKSKQIEFSSFADALLTEPEQVQKKDGTPYTIFTPFMKTAQRLPVPLPVKNAKSNFYSEEIKGILPVSVLDTFISKPNASIRLQGVRMEGLQLLDQITRLEDYDKERNLPAINGTSLLSAHHKFGTISIRETYHKIASYFGNEHTLINQLYWRDFFTHVGFHFPHVFGSAFREKYNAVPWENDEAKFEKWCKGLTGFPIVDAGMRELLATGFMHNRVRMVVASFLTKNLHIDWRWGERFFAKHLVDYDPAVNNGNWQWAASTGCDAQPYFRIFNPWSQQQKFDRECCYIKKWVWELSSLSAKEIHALEKTKPELLSYPDMMVDRMEEAKKSKAIFSQL